MGVGLSLMFGAKGGRSLRSATPDFRGSVSDLNPVHSQVDSTASRCTRGQAQSSPNQWHEPVVHLLRVLPIPGELLSKQLLLILDTEGVQSQDRNENGQPPP